MGVRALRDRGMEHAGERVIVEKARGARGFVGRFEAWEAGTQRFGDGAHAALPAAARAASTIFT